MQEHAMQQHTSADRMTIGMLARAAGVHVESVRFYQRRGLLREPRRPQGGIRHYDAGDLARIRFIKAAQRLGFTLEEVAELLKLDDGTHCKAASEKAQRKLADVRDRLRDLRRVERVLSHLIASCHTAQGQVRCPLIAALQQD